MSSFFKRLILFIIACGAFVLFVFHKADGRLDDSYLKFTSPKQSCMVLGISKAAQGIFPEILEEKLHKPFYNYAFNINASPYGYHYFNCITKKYISSGEENIHILAVDFWSLSSPYTGLKDTVNFREIDLALGQVNNVDSKPNFDYLLNYYKGNFYSVFLKTGSSVINNSGRAEVYLSTDKEKVKKRREPTLAWYKTSKYRISTTRLGYLLRTINFLQKEGKVYLVRLPIHPDLMTIEESKCSDLDAVIKDAIALSDGYLDMTVDNERYTYIDGVHLDTKSGEIATGKIADWILEK